MHVPVKRWKAIKVLIHVLVDTMGIGRVLEVNEAAERTHAKKTDTAEDIANDDQE